ncbi:MAG: methyltransferase domain-containing protein [Brevinematales bacterium]|nr:methyltransferase domain-containing protein [Brevinematales bacterium]
MKRAALFICRSGHSHGMGHLVRMSRFARVLQDSGWDVRLGVISGDAGIINKTSGITEGLDAFRFGEEELAGILPGADVIFADMREISQGLNDVLRGAGKPVMVFDDYGAARDTSEAVANILPHYADKRANFTGIRLNPVKTIEGSGEGILIAFGGSDPAGIGLRAAKALAGKGRPVYWIRGPLAPGEDVPELPGVEIVQSPPEIMTYLAKCSTVITTVGMTMIEALAGGRKVVAIHPTIYHARVGASVDGIIDLGLHTLFSPFALRKVCGKLSEQGGGMIWDTRESSAWIKETADTLAENGAAVCPVCGSVKRAAMFRDGSISLFECLHCRSNYRYGTARAEENYQENYFEETYKKAYGKTYDEDIAAIRGYSARRLEIIEGLTGGARGKKILDIGCAIGVFLDTARARGWDIAGAEVSEYACRAAERRFGIRPAGSIGAVTGSFDAVTLWFTLEHMHDPAALLRKAHGMTNPGGILAMGLPHAEGWFAAGNRKGYTAVRPREHEFEPSISAIGELLTRTGYTVTEIKIFGLHPERIGLPGWDIIKKIQEITQKGDTFEIYARKTSSPD